MQTKQEIDIQNIYDRISQLERRSTMNWYHKDQLVRDLLDLRDTIHMLARKHNNIKQYADDYYKKIDDLVERLL